MHEVVLWATIASILACLACGLGALPLLIPRVDVKNHLPLGYSLAAGLMFSASVFNLIRPAIKDHKLENVLLLGGGMTLGCLFLHFSDKYLSQEKFANSTFFGTGSKRSFLILIAMSLHSLPEGVAVGVGYASGVEGFGTYIAVAIAIHNIPEGLAISIPYRSEGASVWMCFWLAVLSSVPQPLAAIPSAYAVWFFRPLLIPGLGFAAGAMMFLVIQEIIPEALEDASPSYVASFFMIGFGLMLLIQAVL